MGDNVDKYGHCIICHQNLMVERTVDNKTIHMLSPNFSETQFLLDDGSLMRVCICKPCKATRNMNAINVQEEIMKTVINGWQAEVNALVANPDKPEWDEARGKKHMEIYSNKNILNHADYLAPHVIEKKRSELIKLAEHAEKSV